MKKKSGIINFISYIIKLIYLGQWIYIASLIVLFFLLLSHSNIINLDRFSGFKVFYSEINLGQAQMDDGQLHEIILTSGTGRIHIKEYSQKIIYYKLIVALFEALVYLIIIYWLKKIFGNLKLGNFFIRENGIYITKIALSVISITTLIDIFSFFLSKYLSGFLHIPNVIFKSDIYFHFNTIFLGFLILAIAQIFMKGSEMKKEQELTI
ncbi:MAG: DUF2975 domain-containing protein [Chlorobi bacterium]|nr:DUF2975 domain-containing protein [Chlorobiota bacterium]